MRAVVWFVLLFGAAVIAAMALGSNDALVTFYWSGWRLDMSLNLFLFSAVLAGVVLFLSLRALSSLVSLPKRAAQWREGTRERAAQLALRQAMAEFFAARYARAHKAAQQALRTQSAVPRLAEEREFRMLLHAVSAASLHRMQDLPARDAQLALAQAAAEGARGRAMDDGIRLLALEWALDDRDLPRVNEQLAQLPAGVARRTQALRLRLQAARLRGAPMQALQVARLLAKHQGFSGNAGASLVRSLAVEALEQARDAEQLRRTWEAFEPADRGDAFVAARAATRMARFGATDAARDWLEPFWADLGRVGADERATLALALMTCAPGVGTDWLPRLEHAAAQFPADAAVAAAVGVVFAERKLWGKARRLLELAAQATELDPRARRRSLRWLAEIARGEGDTERAQHCERQAAELE